MTDHITDSCTVIPLHQLRHNTYIFFIKLPNHKSQSSSLGTLLLVPGQAFGPNRPVCPGVYRVYIAY
jgi:hypothetical protein